MVVTISSMSKSKRKSKTEMEDGGVAEEHHPQNVPHGREGEEEEEEKASGFLRNFITNMVSAEGSEENKGKEEEKTSGFLKNFLSNMVSAEGGEEKKDQEEGASGNGVDKGGGSESVEDEGGGGNGGRSISNMIADLFHQGETEENVKPGGGGGGGIIDNIVSHFPASLQGDAVTTTDEAAILIHSIIHE